MISIEPAGDLVVGRGVGEQVAGKEPGREPIERHVVVQGLDQPVTPDPLPCVAILLESVTVGVPRGVQPGERHPLSVTRACHQTIHEVFISIRISISDKCVDFLASWRKSRQVDREPLDKGGSAGFGRRRHPFLFELREHKAVDRVTRPLAIVQGGFNRPDGRDESPMGGVVGPSFDPAFQLLLLFGRQPPVRFRGRHQLFGIFRVDPRDEFALDRVFRDDRTGVDCRVTNVEPQIGLTFIPVLSVTIEAVFRQDRPDVAIEVKARSACKGDILGQGPGRTDPHGQKSERMTRRQLTFPMHRGSHSLRVQNPLMIALNPRFCHRNQAIASSGILPFPCR